MNPTLPDVQTQLRAAMQHWASGVTVVAARRGEEVRGMTASSFTSVSLEPPLILFCVNTEAHMWGILEGAAAFSVNILAEGHERTSAHFSGSPIDGYDPLDGGEIPAVTEALVTLYCSPHAIHEGGTHKIVVGRVTGVRIGDPARPMVYWNRGYRSIG
ncbi:MAG: 4-hydroxyphenylacetate 3-monooxygenase reductase subunit [Meiothermus sp.]|nr:4-hydroxyphenylacetate 3-monooxygenase reductase subunit [Meiothermus sp.]